MVADGWGVARRGIIELRMPLANIAATSVAPPHVRSWIERPPAYRPGRFRRHRRISCGHPHRHWRKSDLYIGFGTLADFWLLIGSNLGRPARQKRHVAAPETPPSVQRTRRPTRANPEAIGPLLSP